MVTKLNLEMLPYRCPYCIAWFKKGGKIKITHQYLVPLSIGQNYSNKVLCDVVEMETWYYDNKTSHRGEKKLTAF